MTQLQHDPNARRMRELLARPALWSKEAAELEYLAALSGRRLVWEWYDLQHGQWQPGRYASSSEAAQ